MNQILHINPEENWVLVQPGVIRDELNDFLEEYGLFFGPNTSTANRCNIGGMVGNNSISRIDFLGLKWKVKRKGKERAAVCGEKGDSIAVLARDQGHSSVDYKEWLKPTDGKGSISGENPIPAEILK